MSQQNVNDGALATGLLVNFLKPSLFSLRYFLLQVYFFLFLLNSGVPQLRKLQAGAPQ